MIMQPVCVGGIFTSSVSISLITSVCMCVCFFFDKIFFSI